MKIKSRLVILFTVLVAAINVFALLTIYISSADFATEQFYQRLMEKSVTTAKLLVDVDEVDTELLRIIDENTASLPNEIIAVFNFQNKVVYAYPDTSKVNLDSKLIDRIRLENTVEFTDGDRQSVGLLYSGKYDRFVVIASAYDRYGKGKLANLKWVLIIVFLITILLVAAAGWLFVRKAFSPINQLIDEVNQISEKRLSVRLDEGNGKDELAQLAQTFNRMLVRLEDAFIAQKGFVSYASHQLRTPLTAILGQIEVAMLADRSTADYKQLILSINEELIKLKKLTNGLLYLFQLPSVSNQLPMLSLRLDDVVFKALEQIKKERPNTNIDFAFLEMPQSEQSLVIKGNEELLLQAFINIIENAIKFSNNQPVRVFVSDSQDSLRLTVEDQGIGIPDEHMATIFQPFFRGTYDTSVKGFGIGLALVKQVLDIHHVEIQISKLNPGTSFTLLFQRFKV